MSKCTSDPLISRVALLITTTYPLLFGCTPPTKIVPQGSRELRKVLCVTPSAAALRQRAQVGVLDLEKARGHSEAFVRSIQASRSKPGYSVREVSREVSEFLLRHGILMANCDITVRWPSSNPAGGDVTISGNFRVVSIKDAFPPSDCSWVAEAAWLAVPRQGNFSLTVPAQAISGSSTQVIDAKVAQHVESLLARNVESHVHDLLAADGATRFASRRAVYGVGACMPEACPNEDGIDSLAILRCAQTMRDAENMPLSLKGAAVEDREEIASLARRLCGMMLPKSWTSVMRERLKARPIFISKTTVVLQLANGKKEYTVTRNAFTDESDAVLCRFENLAVEFVSKVNKTLLATVDVEPSTVERPRAEPFKCEKCGRSGESKQTDEGDFVCPKCGEPQADSLPDPLTRFDWRSRFPVPASIVPTGVAVR